MVSSTSDWPMLRATGGRLRSSRFLPPQFSGKLDRADKLMSQLVRLQLLAPLNFCLGWCQIRCLLTAFTSCMKKMQSSLICCLGGIRRVPIPDGCPLRRAMSNPCRERRYGDGKVVSVIVIILSVTITSSSSVYHTKASHCTCLK